MNANKMPYCKNKNVYCSLAERFDVHFTSLLTLNAPLNFYSMQFASFSVKFTLPCTEATSL